MPHTDDLDQGGIVFEAINDSVWRYDHLVQIRLIKFWNDSSHARVSLKHFHSGNDSIAEMFSTLRTVLRDILYQAPEVSL